MFVGGGRPSVAAARAVVPLLGPASDDGGGGGGPPAVAAAATAMAGAGHGGGEPAAGGEGMPTVAAAPWPRPPPSPLRTHPASVRLWVEHAGRALAWLRAHEGGLRALPPLSPPDALPGVGVLIEGRRHGDLEFAVRNWAHFAGPQGWGLLVVHARGNASFVAAAVGGWPAVGTACLDVDDLPLPEYQRLLTSPAFWRRLAAFRRVVVLQTDTAQLGGPRLAEFADHDYVGAPWANTCAECGGVIAPGGADCGHMVDHAALLRLAPDLVGNGGLSLRNPRAMAEACARFRLSTDPPDGREPLPTGNEDTFAALALTLAGARVAPRALAARFAVEQVAPATLDPAGPPPAAGMHKPWAYLPPGVLRAVLATVRYGEFAPTEWPPPPGADSE